MTDESKGPNRYGPILNVLEALESYEHSTWLSVKELAEIIGVDRSTAHRLAAALAGQGWLERDPTSKMYRVGMRLWKVGSLALSGRDVRDYARPHMKRISTLTGESAELGILDGQDVVYIERVEGNEPVRVFASVGARRSTHCVAMGKVLLSELAPKERAHHLSVPLELRTPRTITDLDQFNHHCDEVADRGYALNIGEYHAEAGGIAAAVRDHTGECVAALSVDVPTSRLTPDRIDQLIPIVIEAAHLTSKAWGASQFDDTATAVE